MDPRLDLDKVIRPTLERMEDSIAFGLFERTQFKSNEGIYTVGGLEIMDPASPPNSGWMADMSKGTLMTSYMDFLLEGTEKLHAQAGRYMHPQEHPFTNPAFLPVPLAQRDMGQSPVCDVNINFNEKIKEAYLEAIPKICEAGDDNNYGSSAICDIKVLQDLSRRVHYGNYVAASKFRQNPKEYATLITEQDTEGIMKLLTNEAVEEKILQRLEEKGKKYGISPEFIVEFYRDKIIPMTKEVEVEYFFKAAHSQANIL